MTSFFLLYHMHAYGSTYFRFENQCQLIPLFVQINIRFTGYEFNTYMGSLSEQDLITYLKVE